MRVGFDAWADTLFSLLPGASRPNVELVFWNVAREFYRRSRAWREKLGPFTLGAGQATIFLQPVDQNADICFVEGLEGPYVPSRLLMEDPHTLTLIPPPAESYPYEFWVHVSCAPARGAEALPVYAETHHFSALEVGTLGRMMMQPNKPWTEPSNALMYQRRFEIEISRARANAEKGYAKDAVNWRFHSVSVA